MATRKKNRIGAKRATKAKVRNALSQEDLSQVSGGRGGLGVAGHSHLMKTNPQALQKYYNNLKDPIGLGNVISGIVDRNPKQVLNGLAGVASTFIPGGRGLAAVSAGVRAGLQGAKGGASAYNALAKRTGR